MKIKLTVAALLIALTSNTQAATTGTQRFTVTVPSAISIVAPVNTDLIPGGVHVLMGDGAVKFITDSIDSGNQDSAMSQLQYGGVHAGPFLPVGSASPFGLWGSLGTRANKEVIDKEF